MISHRFFMKIRSCQVVPQLHLPMTCPPASYDLAKCSSMANEDGAMAVIPLLSMILLIKITAVTFLHDVGLSFGCVYFGAAAMTLGQCNRPFRI